MGEYSEKRVKLISEEYEKSKLAYEKYKEECELESGEKLEDDTLFQQFLKYGNLKALLKLSEPALTTGKDVYLR